MSPHSGRWVNMCKRATIVAIAAVMQIQSKRQFRSIVKFVLLTMLILYRATLPNITILYMNWKANRANFSVVSSKFSMQNHLTTFNCVPIYYAQGHKLIPWYLRTGVATPLTATSAYKLKINIIIRCYLLIVDSRDRVVCSRHAQIGLHRGLILIFRRVSLNFSHGDYARS